MIMKNSLNLVCDLTVNLEMNDDAESALHQVAVGKTFNVKIDGNVDFFWLIMVALFGICCYCNGNVFMLRIKVQRSF